MKLLFYRLTFHIYPYFIPVLREFAPLPENRPSFPSAAPQVAREAIQRLRPLLLFLHVELPQFCGVAWVQNPAGFIMGW